MAAFKFRQSDGYKSEETKYPHGTADCVARAISIACEIPYDDTCEVINAILGGKCGHPEKDYARYIGLTGRQTRRVMELFGFEWVALKRIGSHGSIKVKHNMFYIGKTILSMRMHTMAYVNGVCIDDSPKRARNGDAIVYGYWYLSVNKKLKGYVIKAD